MEGRRVRNGLKPSWTRRRGKRPAPAALMRFHQRTLFHADFLKILR